MSAASINSVDHAHPLDGLLYDQTNLEALCAERPLDWEEYAHMNEFHGNASVLKRHAGLPQDEPLPFAVEHAIPYDLDEAYEYDVNCGLPAFLAVHEKSARLYQSRGLDWVPVTGFTYHYAIDLFEQLHPGEAAPRPRCGTIVFPDKSTLLMETDFDRAAFASRLSALPQEYQPVVVCIYWRDFLRGQHEPFLSAGLPVVSCGHLRDPDFMLRLHDLCRRFRYSCANDLAGSFALSILSGCHFFHLRTQGLVQRKGGVTMEMDHDLTMDKPDKSACILASPFPPKDREEQRRLACELSGSAFKRSREELRQIHGKAREMLSGSIAAGQIVFDGSIEDRANLHRLLPKGVDFDGWARSFCKLHIANTREIGTILLRFEFMPASEDCQVLTIRVDQEEYLEISVSRSLHDAFVMIPEGSGACQIDITSNREHTLPGEKRTRAFRISCLELLERETCTIAEPRTMWPANEKQPSPGV